VLANFIDNQSTLKRFLKRKLPPTSDNENLDGGPKRDDENPDAGGRAPQEEMEVQQKPIILLFVLGEFNDGR
jgi:hypothetical protein